MSEKDLQKRVDSLERDNRLLREAVKQGDRIRHKWEDAIRRLKETRLELESRTGECEIAKEYAEDILSSMTDTLAVVTPDGKIRTVNRALCDFLGYEEDELAGQPVKMIFAEESIFERSGIEAIIKKGTIGNVEERYLAKDGRKIPVIFSVSTMRHKDDDIYGLVCVAYDITERKLAEEALSLSEKRLKEAQQISHLGHWELDLVTNRLIWSDEIYRIFGLEPLEFGASYEAFLKAIHPDDMEFVNRAYIESVTERGPYDIVHRLLMKDGRIKYVNEKCRTEYDDNGKPLRSLGTVQDITENKEAEMELEKAKEEAETASRAKTDFLSRMSHELRTPLNSILGFAQMMQLEEENLNDKQGLCVEEIMSAGWHLTDLVNEVLDISKVESGELSLEVRSVDICPIMEECINLIAPLAEEKNIEVSCNLKVCNKETVWGDDTRLKEVFLNLLSNAVKYNVDSGTVTISCDKINKKRLLISVADSGKGISEEDQKLLFKPFSRIKGEDPAVQGTGIGLAISKHLVELMNGSIGMESSPGKGSTFWVKLKIDADTS